MSIEKVIRNGKVAVLYSPGYGAGWSTWNSASEILMFHPDLVAMVESGSQSRITDEWMKDHFNLDVYTGGAEDLKIAWLSEGTRFKIDEYDGLESITTCDDMCLEA